MTIKKQIPKGYKIYRTIEGKFAAHIGPYYTRYKYPNTEFLVLVEDKQSNLNNVAHGGFLMAYADSVGGYFAYNSVKKPIVTVNLNSEFIRPVPVKSLLKAKGKVKKSGKRLIFIEIEMYIEKKIVFKSSGIWQIINIVSNTALKEIIKEPRPSNTQNVNAFDAINPGNDYGMPSGHAQLVFSQVSFIALTFKNNLLTFVAFIQSILTVIQRYQYRKHTAFQLFVGAIIGTLTGCMANHILISRISMS